MDARQVDLLRSVDPLALGARIRSARLSAGMTQQKLAGSAVTVSYVSRIESGKRRPEARVLEAFAARLGIPTEELLVGPPARQTESVRLALDFAELSLETGDPAAALTRIEEVLRHASDVPGSQLNRAKFLRARALEACGQLEDAIVMLEEVLAAEENSESLPAGIALSRCYRESGDLTRAIHTGERVLAGLSDSGLHASDEAVQLAVTIAAAYFEQGDTEYAVRLCRNAVRSTERSGSSKARASAYWNASVMELRRGAAESAVRLAERALGLLGEGRDARNLGRLRSQLGIMQLHLDPPALEEAEANLQAAARELASTSASTVDIVRNDVARARAQLLMGHARTARRMAASAYSASADLAPLLAADARALEGQAAAAEGDLESAKSAYRDAVYLLTSVGADRAAGQLWLDLGGLLESVGEHTAALGAYRSAAVSTGLRVTSTGASAAVR